VTEEDRVGHDLLGQLHGAGLDHRHRVGGAGDDEVERARGHLRRGRVDDELVVDAAHAHRGARALEGDARERQRGHGGDAGEVVGLAVAVVGADRDDELHLVAVAVRGTAGAPGGRSSAR
jgi:hypothetical protein